MMSQETPDCTNENEMEGIVSQENLEADAAGGPLEEDGFGDERAPITAAGAGLDKGNRSNIQAQVLPSHFWKVMIGSLIAGLILGIALGEFRHQGQQQQQIAVVVSHNNATTPTTMEHHQPSKEQDKNKTFPSKEQQQQQNPKIEEVTAPPQSPDKKKKKNNPTQDSKHEIPITKVFQPSQQKNKYSNINQKSKVKNIGPNKKVPKSSSSSSSSSSLKTFKSKPKIKQLMHGKPKKKIVGDISWLLDFAVIGFPKCGTTFLMHYLGMMTQDVDINQGELCSVSNDNLGELVHRFYDSTPYPSPSSTKSTTTKKLMHNGLKCPKDLESKDGLLNYVRYFPQTNFVITMRHPVLWFQSYYNFRVYKHYPRKMPNPSDLIGICACWPYIDDCSTKKRSMSTWGVCTERAKFHHALSRLGKTPMTSREELDLLEDNDLTIHPHPGKIFLLELSQLMPEEPSSHNFTIDFQNFLDLKHALPPLEPFHHSNKYPDEKKRKNFIDICDDSKHKKLRRTLINHGADAARWIQEYFLKSSDVVVSSKELFIDVINRWSSDPCKDKTRFLREVEMFDNII